VSLKRSWNEYDTSRKCTDLLQYPNPFAANLASLSPPQGKDMPTAKKPRLEASTSISTAVDPDTVVDAQTTDTLTASPDDTITVCGVPAEASLPSTGTSRALSPPHNWTTEEDAKLTEVVTELGCNWVAAAALVPGRTNLQCRNRWVRYLDPTIEHATGKWTVEEDTMLTEAVAELGKDWVAVAALVLGRTDKQCRQKYVDNLNTNINKGKWTPEEDAKLIATVMELGNDWVRVAALVPRRTNAQCRKRWVGYLDPTIERTAGR
jgi:hypothetical protein